jgi:hypothetical protein
VLREQKAVPFTDQLVAMSSYILEPGQPSPTPLRRSRWLLIFRLLARASISRSREAGHDWYASAECIPVSHSFSQGNPRGAFPRTAWQCTYEIAADGGTKSQYDRSSPAFRTSLGLSCFYYLYDSVLFSSGLCLSRLVMLRYCCG